MSCTFTEFESKMFISSDELEKHKRKMRFRGSLVLCVHLHFFQLLGFFNLSLSENAQRQRTTECLLKCWSFVLLLILSIVTINTFSSNEQFFFSGDQFGYFNDALKVIIAQAAITINYLESMLRTKSLRAFWIMYDRLHRGSRHTIDEEDEMNKPIRLQLQPCVRFLIIFYGFMLADFIASFLFVQLEVDIDRHVVLFHIMFLPFTYVTYYRCMFFILHIEILRRQLLILAQDLNLLADYTLYAQRVGVFDGFEEFLRCKLRKKQLVYQQIYDMLEQFQQTFGCSILAVLVKMYVRVLVDLYFWYYSTYRGWSQAENIMLIPALFLIPVFLITSKKCTSVIKYVTHQLHSIRSPNNGGVLSQQIQNFSQHILHAKIRINAMGIGDMDGYMLTRIVGSLTTYMVFFIQFMPKLQSA